MMLTTNHREKLSQAAKRRWRRAGKKDRREHAEMMARVRWGKDRKHHVVYLGGPMTGLLPGEARRWRKQVAKVLMARGIKRSRSTLSIDPCTAYKQARPLSRRKRASQMP